MKLPTARTARPRLARAAGWVGSAVTALVAVAIGWSFLLSLAGVNTMYVVSESMEPAFFRGDMLLVATREKTVAVGDVVGYRAPWAGNEVVTHRLVEVSGDTLVAKGDHNSTPDPPFPRSALFGEVVAIYPRVGLFFNPRGVISLSAVGLLAFLTAGFFEARPRRALPGRAPASGEPRRAG